jgi:hypothetical protein
MSIMVKLTAIASALFLLSCHSDVPNLPEFSEVQGYCVFSYKSDGDTIEKCRSLYDISKTECEKLEGTVYDTAPLGKKCEGPVVLSSSSSGGSSSSGIDITDPKYLWCRSPAQPLGYYCDRTPETECIGIDGEMVKAIDEDNCKAGNYL